MCRTAGWRSSPGRSRRAGPYVPGSGGAGMVAARPGDTPVHVALRTSDVDEARAFCRKLFYGPLQVDPVGDTSGFAFAGEVVLLGPITVGEIRYGVDINVTIADLETSYHVLAPLTGSLRSRHRGTAVVADRTRAAVYRPVGGIDLEWPADC